MNDRQIQDYQKLVEQHQSDMKRIREKIRNERDELWDTLSKSNGDSAEAERIHLKLEQIRKRQSCYL